MTNESLYALAGDLLSRVAVELTAAGVALPLLRYVAPASIVAYDDEQLTINVSNLFPGRPGNNAVSIGSDSFTGEHTAEFQIALVRLTPTMNDQGMPPDPAVISANALLQIGDMQAVHRAMLNIRYAAQWVDGNRPFYISGCRPYGPEGGVVGTIGTLQIEVFN